jgi:NAD(P)-dependent dehydrogenase (short-subunit alcohol dehydrogenase family)
VPLAAMNAQVDDGEFAGQRAVVVGGSRGLGAATALLLARGGATALVTYTLGRADARQLQRDAAAHGPALELFRYDITSDSHERLARAATRFGATHLYYFATPRIFAARRDPFDADAFERFARFYVVEFSALCTAVRSAAGALDVFYPSTTALDGDTPRELTEYAAAKAAGETACRALAASCSGLTIVVRRLPRVATDQTATILATPAADPAAVMLPIIREMHRSVARSRQ